MKDVLMGNEPTYKELEEKVRKLRKTSGDLKIAENKLRESEREFKIRNRIAEIFLTVPDDDMYAEVLDVVLKAMKSKFGLFGYIDENGALVCPSMTREIFAQCQVPDKNIVFPREIWGGLWGRSLIEKKTLYSNKPFRVPHGHLPITRSMSLPILYHDQLIGTFHVANKETDYDEKNRALLETIADKIAPVLHARLQRDRQEKERKEAEEALRLSEERSREITEKAAIGIALLDVEGQLLECNPALREMLGYTNIELCSMHFTDITHPDDVEAGVKLVQEMIAGKRKCFTMEKRYIRKDGQIIWGNLTASLVRDAEGNPQYGVGMVEDITERKQAEEKLDKYRYHLEDLVVKRTAKIKSTIKDLRVKITEHKRVEEALETERQRFFGVLDALPSFIYLQAPDHSIRFSNSYFRKLFGDPEGKLCYEVIWGANKPCEPCPTLCVIDTKKPQEWEWTRPDDGRIYQIYDYPFTDIDGSPLVLEMGVDITERKRVEEAVHDSEERYRSLVENIKLGITLIDTDYNIVMINAGSSGMFNKTAGELIGKKCYREFEKRKKVCSHCPGTLAMSTGLPQEVKTEGIRDDGTRFSVWIRAFPTFGPDGKPTGFIEVVEDITERKKAEEQLRKLSHAIEHSPTTIMITDAGGKIEYVNPKFTELTGYSADEVMGKNPSFLNSRKQPKEFYNQLWDTIQCGGTWHGEFLNKKKSGELYWEEASISPVVDKDGGITHYVAVKEDITERKLVEEELAKHREHLQDLVEERTAELKQTHKQLLHAEKLSAIGKLSASIAHEFNNPIFGIRNVLEGIKNRFPLKKLDKEEINLAISECNRIKNLIFSLQRFHKPTTGHVASVDIHKALDDMLLLCKKQFNVKNIKVQKTYAAHMPKIRVVEDQIKQVVLNLLTNAQEAIPKKGGTIHVKTKASADTMSVQIQDSGVGIKAKDKNKIFEPFFSTKPVVKGAGLGLSVSYGIIKTHGGDIKFESQPSKGTVFTVTLPIIKAV